MKDLLVQSRFRNLQLWDLLNGRNVADVCRELNISQSTFGKLLNLQISPRVRKSGRAYKGIVTDTYRKIVLIISAHFNMLPEDLFPDSLYDLALPDRVEHTYDSTKLLPLLAAGGEKYALPPAQFDAVVSDELIDKMREAIHSLKKPQQRRVLKLRFGLEDGIEHSLVEVGKIMGLSGERIRMIESQALRHMRHPIRATALVPFVNFCAYDEEDADSQSTSPSPSS